MSSSTGNSSEPLPHRFYLRVGVGTTALALALLALFNLAVDPLGAYPLVALKVFQSYRGRFTSRAGKSEAVAHANFDVLLVGTSRVEFGLPVSHSVYGRGRVYNLGLEGTSLPELLAVLDFAIRQHCPEQVVFGIDFFLFSDVRAARPDFENSRFNSHLNIVEYHLRNLLDWDATARSWSLVERVKHHKPPQAANLGFVPKKVPLGMSQRTVFERRIQDFLVNPETYGAYHYSPARLKEFREMVRLCQSHNIDLKIFIPPVHTLQLETIRVAGLWPTFEQWKRDAVHIVAEETAGRATPLWDFTGFKGEVAEEVPPSGDQTTRMKWYIDSSHFTPALGQVVLDRMFPQAPLAGHATDLGVPLAPANVEEHLERMRGDREAYAAAHPNEIEWLRQLALQKSEKAKKPDTTAE